MKRLDDVGCKYIRTDENGGISIVSNGDDLEIETYIKDSS